MLSKHSADFFKQLKLETTNQLLKMCGKIHFLISGETYLKITAQNRFCKKIYSLSKIRLG